MSNTRVWVKTFSPLADHLTRVHELSGIERKYWLQFAKLQNANVVRVYEKEAGPKTIFSINQRAQGEKTHTKMWRVWRFWPFWLSFRVKLPIIFLR